MKEVSPESYLLGEHFHDGTPHLQGQELDASMNYQGFTFPVWHWLSRYESPSLLGRSHDEKQPVSGEVMAAQWQVFKAAIPWQIAIQQFNLLGSHDTSRIFSILGEDESRLKVAATLLFTYPGVPCIYYGDEIGMKGEADPDCRRCMEWDEQKWNDSIREHYQSLIQLRKDAKALREGGFQLLLTEDESVAFLRELPQQRIIIVAQRAGGLESLSVGVGGIADGSHWHEFFSGVETTITGGLLTLNPSSGADSQIWIEEK
jgi:alpha-glucosidase